MDSNEQDLSVLAYARFHGLCKEYTQELNLQHLDIPSVEDLQSDLGGSIELPSANILANCIKERLIMSKDVMILLRDVCSEPRLPDDETFTKDNRHKFSRMKHEVPILLTDNELDLRSFGSTDIPKFNSLMIPLEIVDSKNDEGCEWPSYYHTYSKNWDRRIRTEKLTVPKDVLLFLQNAIKDSFTKEDAEEIKAASLSYKRNPALRPLSPPLLPVMPPMPPYIPSSPANRLELLPESSDSNFQEAKALEEHIMAHDSLIVLNEDASGSQDSDQMLLDSALGTLSDSPEPSLTPLAKRKLHDLKVEGPLTPPIITQSAEKTLKSVSFPEMLHEYIPELPSKYESGDNILNSQDSFAPFFEEAAPAVEELNRKLKNENLSDADTTKRVNVPNLDFSLPIAPWAEFNHRSKGKYPSGESELEAHMKFLVRVKRDQLKSALSWRGLAALDRSLPWSPFPIESAKVDLHEELEQDEFLHTLLEELSIDGFADSASLVWKPERLRLFDDHDDSDKELGMAEFSEREEKDIGSLLRKRRLEIEDNDSYRYPPTQLKKPKASLNEAEVSKHRKRKSSPHTVSKLAGDKDLTLNGFSAATALNKFMATRGKEVKQTVTQASPLEIVYSTPKPVIPEPHHESPTVSQTVISKPAPEDGIPHKMKPKQRPFPPLPENLPPAAFFISSSLLLQRHLTRLITRYYPDAEFTDRDFTLQYSPFAEADMILSPSTGLVLTTLQQIKQRALPGQPEKSGIKQRVQALQNRYERVILLVSQGLLEENSKENEIVADSRDATALKDLNRFADKLEADVVVKYIPGGEEALAKAVVGEMAEWGLPRGTIVQGEKEFIILQEETHWELFLRRIGLNPYAAQAVLFTLKDPFSIELPLPLAPTSLMHPKARIVEVWGLQAFVLMPAEERMQRFQVLLGGRSVVEKVNKVLDRRWISAVNGFTGLRNLWCENR
ncbi:hypothetical protein GQ43DRAFT_364099 [Delitschia confertaspora ATCC 74209]|uniref:Uncharacterized protein n=1 Tax=Delitschia confertaspora ATCC 74209 TaxID=1513339 RepID=A0A9P4JT46_9PLEO|nr:hypothetical protein GQ43DRAFT_364099 [Delitschia confertaspora ATCC 74209]